MSEPEKILGDALRGELKALVREALREEILTIGNKMHCDDDRGLVRADKAAEYLSVSKSWLYKNAERLPFSTKIGGARRFDKDGMRRWLQSQRR